MSLDVLQQTWQSQKVARIRVEPEMMFRELRRNQRKMKATLFWRDFREVFVAGALAVFFTVRGVRDGSWPWLVLVSGCLWVGGFILVDRFRRRGLAASFGDSLMGCVNASLNELRHQIWLLKNVFWWYLLPLAIGLAVEFIEAAITGGGSAWERIVGLIWRIGFCALVFAGVYWINQVAVRKQLEPRRQELLAVRERLVRGEEREAGS